MNVLYHLDTAMLSYLIIMLTDNDSLAYNLHMYWYDGKYPL